MLMGSGHAQASRWRYRHLPSARTDRGAATQHDARRPAALNALTVRMIHELAATFRRLAADESVRAAVLTGAGRAFSAGVDLTAAQQVFQGDVEDRDRDPVAQMEACPFPIIGAVHGPAITAGFELALNCDILLATSDAVFVDTHCKFGLMPSWGLSQILPRLIGANRAREASLAARPIDAAKAERWGLVSAVVPGGREALLAEALRLAREIAGNSPAVVRGYKRVLADGLAGTLAEGRALERQRAWAFYRAMSPEAFRAMTEYIASRKVKVRTFSRPPRFRVFF